MFKWTIKNKFQWNHNRNSNSLIKIMRLKMSSVKLRPFSLPQCVKHTFSALLWLTLLNLNHDVITVWGCFPNYCPFVKGIHRSRWIPFICHFNWGRVTHVCIANLITIGSDNGLSPDRHQAIIWSNVGILSIGPSKINFSEFLIET